MKNMLKTIIPLTHWCVLLIIITFFHEVTEKTIWVGLVVLV